MITRAVILANGELEHPEIIHTRLAAWQGMRVIAADGGSRHAAALGLHIDDMVGDADSLTSEERETLHQGGSRFHLAPPDKDESDLELALLLAAREGVSEICILGALGGRLDMMMANILLLTLPRLMAIDVRIWHGQQTAWLIRPPGDDIAGAPGDTLSLIPLGGNALNVSTEGLAYPLEDGILLFGPARGVSNVLTNSKVTVRFREGLLLAVHTPGCAE